MSGMNAVHDSAGNIALIGTLTLVGVFAWGLAESASAQTSPQSESASEHQKDPGFSSKFNRLAISLIVLICASEVGIQQWYRKSESSTQTLSISLSTLPGWEPITVNEYARKTLAYTAAQGFAFNDLARNERWLAYVFNWSGDVGKMGGAFSHDPTVCLPSIGSTLDQSLGRISIPIARESVDFDWYRFTTQRGQTQHVFFQVFDGNTGNPLAYQSDPRTRSTFRLQLVRRAQQTLNVFQTTFVLEGIDSNESALATMQQKLPQLVRFKRITL
jgi:hypothetical protein